MAFDYDAMQTIGDDLIDNFGKTVTVRQEKSDTDKANPWEGKTDDVQTYNTKCAFIDIHEKDIDGTIVKKGDRLGYISPKGESFAIQLKHQIIDGSTTYKIMNVETINPAGTNLLYILRLRK
jgi:hypothetical protein